MPILEYVLGIVAAALLGIGFVFQQDAAQRAPSAHFLRPRLLTDLVRRPRWLVGLAAMVAGNLLSAWVVGHLALSFAEPLLATSLLFALLLAGPLSGQALHKPELAGAVTLVAGVTVLSLARSAHLAQVRVGSPANWPSAAAAVAFLALACAELGRRRAANQRAILTGTSTGLVFGLGDALTRRTVQVLGAGHLTALLTSWPAYCLAVVTLAGLLLMQSAFNAGPLHVSLPGLTAAEPVAGIVLGIVVFGDRVHVSPAMIAVEAAGLVALVTGAVIVARAPALSRLRGGRLPGETGQAADTCRGRRRVGPAPTAPGCGAGSSAPQKKCLRPPTA